MEYIRGLLWRFFVRLVAKRACEMYGGTGERGERFNTANFISAFSEQTGVSLSSFDAVRALNFAGYVRGFGGCHWFGPDAKSARMAAATFAEEKVG